VSADGAAAVARLVHDGKTRRAMLVELPARFVNRLVRVTTSGRGPHNFFDVHVGGTAVIRRHFAAHVALGDDADELATSLIRYHGRASVA